MTDDEWSTCTKPAAMLTSIRGKLSDRKLRLFTCACLRRTWHWLADDCLRQATEETESTAEQTSGMPGEAEPWWLRLSIEPAFATLLGMPDADVYDNVKSTLFFAAYIHAEGQVASWRAAHDDADPVWRSHVAKLRTASANEAEAFAQTSLLRDVVGIPSRRICMDPLVLGWNDGIVQKLAQAAYDERLLPEGTLDVSRMAVLADALEEAGCTDPDILGHLRGPGPHVRGCWVVDLCLGKS
jgi:hypothetical protein